MVLFQHGSKQQIQILDHVPNWEWSNSGMSSCYMYSIGNRLYSIYIYTHQVLPSGLFGCFKWPFQGWKRDLHLGDQKVTWKKLVHILYIYKHMIRNNPIFSTPNTPLGRFSNSLQPQQRPCDLVSKVMLPLSARRPVALVRECVVCAWAYV